MGGEWPTLSLREANVTLIDCDHRTPPASEAGYPYVAIPQLRGGRVDLSNVRRIKREHLVEWTRKAKPSANDVILSRRCNPGETAVVPFDLEFALGQNLVLLRADGTKVHPPFLRWLVRGPEWWDQIGKFLNVGAIFDSLRCADVPSFELRIPPVPEQRAIAHILGTLDDKIELNRRMNETLEAMARALFKSWFVDFDPVRAKAAGRDPGLPQPLADLFPDSFEDSELGEIPKGWEVGCVDDEFDLTMGQSPPGPTYNEVGDGLPFYQGRTDFGFRFPTRRVYCTSPTRLAKEGDTLISVRAPVGDINMAAEDCVIGRGVAAARHKTGSRSYSYQFMRAQADAFDRFEAEGTVFGSIGKKDFHAIACVVPPRGLVAEFERRLAPLDGRIEVTDHEARTLAALRDTLLPKLISGELRVKDAERFIAGSPANATGAQA
ncbi:MAG: restriction endonuclease subunit S [Candidatus Nanopelagicales bacterium]|nr:restriction endonuclease subunit S [Candidatus Nanopelagicales bacterium]MDZ4249624.1 restriction endonuclease subunit S [Candidatus Nanopelagicales bacterium]